MIFHETKENPNYILVEVKHELLTLILRLNEKEIDLKVLKEMRFIHEKLFEFEEQVGYYLDYAAIRKDSIVGEYLINHIDGRDIINESLLISLKKITNALRVALFENNEEMVHSLFSMINHRKVGTYNQLKKYYSEGTLKYILEHDSFQEYLQNSITLKKKNNILFMKMVNIFKNHSMKKVKKFR